MIIVDRARWRTENDAQKCFQIPSFCVTLFELKLAFHIYRVQWHKLAVSPIEL